MDRTQQPRSAALALPGRNVWGRRACDRTAALRARLLTGDAEAAQEAHSRFHLLYWECRGQQILPLRDERTPPHRGDR